MDIMNTSDLFVHFLRTHELISVTGIEAKLKMPASTLKQAMTGKRKIPEKYWYDLGLLLRDYGFDWPQIEDSEIVGYELITDDHRFL